MQYNLRSKYWQYHVSANFINSYCKNRKKQQRRNTIITRPRTNNTRCQTQPKPTEPFASKSHVDGKQTSVSASMANMKKSKQLMVEHEGVIQQKQQEELPTNKLTYKKQLQLLTLTPYFFIVVYISHLNNNTFSFKVSGHTFMTSTKNDQFCYSPNPRPNFLLRC